MCSENIDFYLGYQADGREKVGNHREQRASRDSKPYDRSKSWRSSDCHDPKQSTQLITVDGDERADPSRCLVADRSCERDRIDRIRSTRLYRVDSPRRGDTLFKIFFILPFRRMCFFQPEPEQPPACVSEVKGRVRLFGIKSKKHQWEENDNRAKDCWNYDAWTREIANLSKTYNWIGIEKKKRRNTRMFMRWISILSAEWVPSSGFSVTVNRQFSSITHN